MLRVRDNAFTNYYRMGYVKSNNRLDTGISAWRKYGTTRGAETMNRFYCVHCQQDIHITKVKTRRVFPQAPPPWAAFEFCEVPVCPLCEGELLDTTAPKRKDETCDTK
jgi:hypothetical protein